jgi:hypothetical protein
LQEVGSFASNVATVVGAILIPLIIWRSGGRRDKTAATIGLIRSLATDSGLYERAARVFQHRMFKNGVLGATDPYATDGIQALAHDCIVILNYLDVACVEIMKGTVDHDLLYSTSRDPIIGAESLLQLLSKTVGTDRSSSFPALVSIIGIWKQRAAAEGVSLVQPISAETAPHQPPN